MNSVRLGKKPYTVLRVEKSNDENGVYVHGRFVPAERKEVKILANIQPTFNNVMTKLLPEGDQTRDMIWISSNHYVRGSISGGENTETPKSLAEADYICYDGAIWIVKMVKKYQNFGEHCECIAIKLNEDLECLKEGLMSQGR